MSQAVTRRDVLGRAEWTASLVIALAIGACAVSLLAYMEAREIRPAHDDAFISYVYARNFAAGRGLVFNPGERVWGFTSPAQTLLLSGLTALGFDTFSISIVFGVIFIAASAFLVYELFDRWLPAVFAGAIALHLMANGAGNYSLVSLETNFLLFSQLLFLAAIRSNRPRLACGAGALSCLVRPDAVLLVVPVLALHRKSLRYSDLAYFAAPGLVWVIIAYSYYGAILPNSFFAKRELTPFAEYLVLMFRALFPLTEDVLSWRNLSTFARPLLLLVAGARLFSMRERSLFYALLVYPWLLILSYASIGAPVSHGWETFSGRFFLWLALAFGAGTVLVWLARAVLGRLFESPGRSFAVVHALIAAVYLGFAVLPSAKQLVRYLEAQETSFWMGARHDTYRTIADWLGEKVPPQTSLAVAEVGTLAYYADLFVIDLSGIITRTWRAGRRMNFSEILKECRPSYLLLAGEREELDAGEGGRYERVAYFEKQGFLDFSLLKRAPEIQP